ncbi:hypothetical protein CHX27_01820, partial [Flavobacterium aurantiibacter]
MLHVNFYFFIGPLFYMYTKSVLGILRKEDYFLFVPGVFEFFFQLYFYADPNFYFEFVLGKYKSWNLFTYDVVLNLFTVFFSVKAILLIKKYRNDIVNIYTVEVRKSLRWISTAGVVLIIQFGLIAFMLFFLKENGLEQILNYIAVPIAGITVYWISFYGLTQKNLNLSLIFDQDDEKRKSNENVKQISKDKDSDIVEVKPATILKYEEIVDFFNKTKVYKDKDLSIYKIANLMQISYKDVSFSINAVGKKNFNQFVNEFRVNEAIRLLDNEKIELYNLSGIAEEVGFNCKLPIKSNCLKVEK